MLIEIAPGIPLQNHVLARIGFPVRVAPDLKQMEARLFCDEPMRFQAECATRVPLLSGAYYSSRSRKS